MNSPTPIPADAPRRLSAGRIVLGLAAAWFCVHAAIYAVGMWRLDSAVYRHFEYVMTHFFAWQAVGFFATAAVVYTRRPASMGRVLGGYLIGSTVVLLAFSQNAVLVANLAVLLLWTACAVQGVRRAIGWAVGERYATWGVATAAVYAALVPITFFLGVLHAITPLNVAVLGIAAALPGAIFGLRRVTSLTGRLTSFGSHAERGNQDCGGHKPWSIVEWYLLEAIWGILAIEFVGAAASERSFDTVRVHLPYMLQVIADHGLSHQYACWHRLQPMAVQTYGAALATVGSIAAAKWFSWLALAALLLLLFEEIRRRSGSRQLGLFAGAAVLGCPVLAGLSSSLHNDHIVALLCTAGFVVMFRAMRPPCLRGILLAAAIMGSMIQVKYTGLVFGAVWGVFLTIDLLWTCGWRVAVLWSAAAGVVLAATASPWHVYVYMGTGNPFYPYLDQWFPSPYWIKGFTPQQVFAEVFKLPPGIVGAASFPWGATYQSASYVEGHDGMLGFWALALAPCWLLARFVRKRGMASYSYWDMAIVGVAMIVGIVTYTPYIRYWMPAYPLLVASCVLAAGALIGSIGWRPEGHWAPVVAGTALTMLLLLPAPILCANVPWDAYAKQVSAEEDLAQSFQGYQATQQLNAILAPNDGVLCTGCTGVYLVGGRPYEFAFWWNGIHHIYDCPSFADFCRRNGIRYWMVNHFSVMSRRLCGSEKIVAEYWTDARLVTASGDVAVYDVSPRRPEGSPATVRREWPTVLENPPQPWTPSGSSRHWVNLAAPVAARPADETIAVTGGASIAHRLDPEFPGGLCRVSLGVESNQHTDPLLELTWYDAEGNVLSRTNSGAYGESNYEAWICAVAPPDAKVGWLSLREWKQRPISVRRATATFWQPQTASAVARHDKPRDGTGGVR